MVVGPTTPDQCGQNPAYAVITKLCVKARSVVYFGAIRSPSSEAKLITGLWELHCSWSARALLGTAGRIISITLCTEYLYLCAYEIRSGCIASTVMLQSVFPLG